MTTHTPLLQSTLTVASNVKDLVPKPASVTVRLGEFPLSSSTAIVSQTADSKLMQIAESLASRLRPATGFALPVRISNESTGNILLKLVEDTSLGDEGYELNVTPSYIILQANKPAGVFYGTQTLRQLLPPEIELLKVQTARWAVSAGTIRDVPRFEWRGTMLDVARHFFTVQDVKRFIELAAHYKLNRLHLHLSDDQGWRLEIKSWDRLTAHGGSTEVGGGEGGFYTQDDYTELVSFAAQHYMTIIPEIDMPGHTNAALASYAELNCDDTAPPLYTGTKVGFSSLCVDKELTYQFVSDVIRELAALTPGAYIHIGGDETQATADEDYIRFVQRVQEIVRANGKQMIGWEEIAQARLLPDSIVQHWHSELAAHGADQGAGVILSPSSKAYLDMKYDDTTELGLSWAGNLDVVNAYSWDPTTEIEGVNEHDILGVEAPLWSETLETLKDVEYMAFPRLIGIAEIAWSPKSNRDWDEYRERLAAQGTRLNNMNVTYYLAPQVPWR